jgi:hypothetical protein
MIGRRLLALGLAASLTAGCTVYEVAPGVYASPHIFRSFPVILMV